MCDIWTDIHSTVLHVLWYVKTYRTNCVTPWTIYAPMWRYLLKNVEGKRIHLDLWWFNQLLIVCEQKNKGAELHYSLENPQCTILIKNVLLHCGLNIPMWCISYFSTRKFGKKKIDIYCLQKIFSWTFGPSSLFCSHCIFLKCMVINLKKLVLSLCFRKTGPSNSWGTMK